MIEKYKLPTGYLLVSEYSKGKLETLSIGDYGKSKNIKAQFLGFDKDINGVPNGNIKPLSEKWVITLSTQYGCPMKCTFCDCPKIQFKGNATEEDLQDQLIDAINCFPEIRYTDRLNIHFARMGEPMFNFKNIYNFSYNLKRKYVYNFRDVYDLRFEVIHPVLTTCLPKGIEHTEEYLEDWCAVMKNDIYSGQAGLQLSINSTNENQRKEMFQDKVLDIPDISRATRDLPNPLGRKYCLNFAYASDYEIDPKKLDNYFDKDKWMVKITPIHNNNSCKENGIETVGGYNSFTPYKKVEEELVKEGWDTLVFIPSMDEENSLITCGNAILSGSELKI